MHLVLLDLDGTLADTAPDLGGALNALRVERGEAPIDMKPLTKAIGRGTPAMLEAAFGIAADAAEFGPLRDRFLDLYAARVSSETRLYDGIDDLLDELESRGISWGVVTNKPARFTDPLLAALKLTRRAACVVSGDTLPQRKPDPAPLLHAAREVAADPAHCVYVGDAETDIIAARAAGMRALVAGWGYLGADDVPARWGAAAVVSAPKDLATWLLVHG
jgi:2-phosphoglycolate phosphatase